MQGLKKTSYSIIIAKLAEMQHYNFYAAVERKNGCHLTM